MIHVQERRNAYDSGWIIIHDTHVYCILFMYNYYISMKIMTGKAEP